VLGRDAGRGLGQVDEMVGQLRRPNHIGAVDIDVGVAGREPQAVLAELVGGRLRHLGDVHRVPRAALEDVQLRAQDFDILADRAGDDGQLGRLRRRGERNRDGYNGRDFANDGVHGVLLR